MNNLRAHQLEQAEAAFNDELRRTEAEHRAAQRRITQTHRIMCILLWVVVLIPPLIIALALWSGRK